MHLLYTAAFTDIVLTVKSRHNLTNHHFIVYQLRRIALFSFILLCFQMHKTWRESLISTKHERVWSTGKISFSNSGYHFQLCPVSRWLSSQEKQMEKKSISVSTFVRMCSPPVLFGVTGPLPVPWEGGWEDGVRWVQSSAWSELRFTDSELLWFLFFLIISYSFLFLFLLLLLSRRWLQRKPH